MYRGLRFVSWHKPILRGAAVQCLMDSVTMIDYFPVNMHVHAIICLVMHSLAVRPLDPR